MPARAERIKQTSRYGSSTTPLRLIRAHMKFQNIYLPGPGPESAQNPRVPEEQNYSIRYCFNMDSIMVFIVDLTKTKTPGRPPPPSRPHRPGRTGPGRPTRPTRPAGQALAAPPGPPARAAPPGRPSRGQCLFAKVSFWLARGHFVSALAYLLVFVVCRFSFASNGCRLAFGQILRWVIVAALWMAIKF